MTDKPTGVFVRLPLSDEQRAVLVDAVTFGKPDDSHDKDILAIGTPVTSRDIPVVTTLGTLRDPVPCVRQSDHLAKLAEKDAEIARKDEEIERLKRIAYSGRGTMTYTIHSPARFADETLKGPEA